MYHKNLLIASLLFAVSVCSCAVASGEKDCTVTVGVPMDMLVMQLDKFYHDHYKPYKSMQERLPCDVRMEFFKRCADVLDAMDQGGVDVAAGRITCYLKARARLGATPVFSIMIDGRKTHRGVFLVGKDSPFREIGDLRGARLSVVNSDSIIYHYFPWKYVWEATGMKLNDFFVEAKRCPTVTAAVYSVTMGLSDVVVADEEILAFKGVGDKLRAVAYSFDIPYPVIFISGNPRPGVKETADAVVKELQAMPMESRIGNMVGLQSGIKVVEDPEYAEFKEVLRREGLLDKIMDREPRAYPDKAGKHPID